MTALLTNMSNHDVHVQSHSNDVNAFHKVLAEVFHDAFKEVT